MIMIIRKMAARGYYYDDIESTKGNYRFFYQGSCFPLAFATVADIRAWLNGIDE